MKAGDRVRVFTYTMGHQTGTEDYIIEEFRHCLGVFQSERHRTRDDFTPLCDLYCNGPETEEKYMSNYGTYLTNQVQAWMDLPQS